jgi:hypothetical protein
MTTINRGPHTKYAPKGPLFPRYTTGSRCPARINKMILKLRIFTSIWRCPTFHGMQPYLE